MARVNLERTRTAWELVNRTGEIDPELLHADTVSRARAGLPGPCTYRGHGAVAEPRDEWAGKFEDFTVGVEELIDAGEYVVAGSRLRGRVSGSSSQKVEMTEPHVGRWSAGSPVEAREYATKGEAPGAVGLG